ncbi:MAG: DUF2911 domain-containing protein [Christiangramia sp.]|uniref:Uncharacterized protein n=1 Tax=Christiangramia flava JLT2011 TaxID=1229726 RepID=A0A1L7I2N3_9FLAO|nr:DUF2911 domain-containing protein [Christiangramia flava]APU67443.1 hypothetical protein GRFL_0719 [Christiangramia flava JLT2011]MAM19634.1 DUF2911 domain-containing protein [Christiangramia sp.]OSS40029.1 hypothetical protein C723_1146 [Christiangramia flava JLT2011]|tara:strand:- start:28 stop:591 length:564 start_codon:yes stop_codon:yes gene_type:complete
MKKIAIGIASVLCLMLTPQMNAQTEKDSGLNFSKLDASPMDLALYRDKEDAPIARVIYSRPQKREREVFGKLVPYGKVWRTGANETTELTLYRNMKVGDKVIQAGTYSLFTIPNEKEWTIILNSSTNTWGAYEYTDVKDEVRITVPVRQAPNTIEALSMAFEEAPGGANLLIGWDNSYVKVPFKNAK